jgi:hypothetical protein
MPADDISDEARIILAAYEERMKGLFMVLAESLAIGEPERAIADRFRRALRSAKRARALALQAAADEQASEIQAVPAAPGTPAAKS